MVALVTNYFGIKYCFIFVNHFRLKSVVNKPSYFIR